MYGPVVGENAAKISCTMHLRLVFAAVVVGVEGGKSLGVGGDRGWRAARAGLLLQRLDVLLWRLLLEWLCGDRNFCG